MQRYRINYHWLIGVFVTGLVAAIAAFFVWSWQVNRKAGDFLTRAEQALANEDTMEAFDYFNKYVQLRPDEVDARISLGEAAIKVLKDKDSGLEEWSRAIGTLEQSVRMTDDEDLRRELAEIWIMFRRPQDAMGHIEDLLDSNPSDPQLNTMLLRTVFQAKDYSRAKEIGFTLIGYDRKTDEFNREKSSTTSEAEVEDEIDAYVIVTDLVAKRDKNTELARRVMDEMIAAHPGSANANLRYSIFLTSVDEKEEGKKHLGKAYQLDPNNAEVLSRKGLVALDEAFAETTTDEPSDDQQAEQIKAAKLEEAREYYAAGLKEHGDNPHFYRMMADVEQRLNKPEAAIQQLDEGIEKLDEGMSIELVLYKLELLLDQKDYAGVRNEIKRLSKLNRPDMQPLIEFFSARIKFSQQKWLEAARDLKRVAPLLINRAQYFTSVRPPNYEIMARYMLGVSYENQGVSDLALQAYSTILNDFPKHPAALKGRDRIQSRMQPRKGNDGIDFDQLVEKTLELPENEQDWGKIDELLEKVSEERGLTEARRKLLQAKVLMKRGMIKDAKDLIRQAAKDAPEDLNVHFAAIVLVLSDPDGGPAAAMKLLDRLEEKWGRSLRSMTQRADLLVALRPEDVSTQLRVLLSSAEELSELDQLRFLKITALKFEQLGEIADARELFLQAADSEPNNLPLRMHVFDLALRQKDEKAMQAAQTGILDVVGDEKNASYILTEVKRRIMNFGNGKLSREELASALDLLDEALRQRPEWHELHVAYGQLLLVLERDRELAMQYFDQALKYGPAKSTVVSMLVKLLVERGLYKEARERMELLNKKYRPRLLGRLEAQILLATGDEEAGFERAKDLAASQPDNASTQIWFSRIAQDQKKLDDAVAALRKGLELSPSDPDNWIRLVGLYAEQKKVDDLQLAIREAHLATDEEYLPILTGKYNEILSRWQPAETIYLAAYKDDFDKLSIARRMADFYLLWSSKDKTNIKRATPFINRILRAANEGKAAADNPHVIWARQKAARILFAENNYQQSIKAEQLLRQSTVNSEMTTEEATLLTDILVSRNDPQSIMQALDILSKRQESGKLTPKGALQLARLLSRTNQWEESQSLMLEQIAARKSNPAVWTTYVDLMIDQGEYSRAETGLKRLQEIEPKNKSLVQLAARLASERGDQAGLTRLLMSLTPRLSGSKNQAELDQVLSIAKLAERFGDYQYAEKLYRFHATRLPDQTINLARFLANHGDTEEAVDLLKRLYSENVDQVIRIANTMLSTRRGEIGDKHDEDVDRMINAALRDDPDSITRQLARAEASEAQGDSELCIATYEQVLARDDLRPQIRAAVMNNLGFQFALLNQRLDEADQLIENAIQTFGPVEDMLDTRAVLRMAQEKYDLAIEDMELALVVSRDPVKYYHLAKAHALAGNGPAAIEAWEKAQALGFQEESLPGLEKPSVKPIVRQIESFQTQNAKL